MPKVEVTIPDDIEVELDRITEEGEFVNRNEAAEEILTLGLNAYEPASGVESEEDFYSEEMQETADRPLDDDFEF